MKDEVCQELCKLNKKCAVTDLRTCVLHRDLKRQRDRLRVHQKRVTDFLTKRGIVLPEGWINSEFQEDGSLKIYVDGDVIINE